MAKNKYNVIVSERADRMLLSCTAFLTNVSIPAAKRLLRDYRKSIKVLAETPYQFPFADDLDVPGIPLETYRKCLFDDRYKAIFLIEDDDVFIDAVIDCRQENKGLF